MAEYENVLYQGLKVSYQTGGHNQHMWGDQAMYRNKL